MILARLFSKIFKKDGGILLIDSQGQKYICGKPDLHNPITLQLLKKNLNWKLIIDPELEFPDFELIDLLSYFKLEPITIKGCFGYGLKEIVKQLYNLKLIENQWNDDTDGLGAMVQLMKVSELAESQNIPIKRFTEIKKIIYYNYMDCRVIIDILKMLEGMV